jgi:hypothetical protein
MRYGKFRLSPRSLPSFFPAHILYSRYKDKWCYYCMRNCPLLTMNYIAFELARKMYLNTLLSIASSAAYVTHSCYVVCRCNSWCNNGTWTSTASLTVSSTVLLDAIPQLIVKRFRGEIKIQNWSDSTRHTITLPYSTRHTITLPYSTRHTITLPYSTRHTITLPYSTRHTITLPYSTRHTITLPYSTRHTITLPYSTRHSQRAIRRIFTATETVVIPHNTAVC